MYSQFSLFKKRLWYFLGMCLCLPELGSAQQVDSLLNQAILLRESYKDEQALTLFEQILQMDPNQYESLWSASLMAAWLGNRQQDKNRKIELFKKSEQYVNRAMLIDSTTYHVLYAKAVSLGRMALISSTRDRVASAKVIKYYGDKAIHADSTQAGGWGLIGRWHHKLVTLNFAERAVASLLFGGLPGGASQEMALHCLKKAVTLDPKFILYKRDLAKTLHDFGFIDQAKTVAKEVLNMKGGTPEDERYYREMRDILN